MRTFRFIAGVLTISVVTALTGCFAWYDYNSASNYGSKRDMPRQDTSRAYQTQQQYAPVSHKITKLEMNQFLSDQVAAMYGVNSAIILMGDSVAYTAITLDGTATGTRGRREIDAPEANNYGLANNINSMYIRPSDRGNPDQRISITSVAETEMHHEHLSHLFKQKIAEKIRSLQPSVTDVYITANRDIVDQFNRLAIESWHGRSLEPYRGYFTSLMEMTFGTSPTIPNQAEGNGREH